MAASVATDGVQQQLATPTMTAMAVHGQSKPIGSAPPVYSSTPISDPRVIPRVDSPALITAGASSNPPDASHHAAPDTRGVAILSSAADNSFLNATPVTKVPTSAINDKQKTARNARHHVQESTLELRQARAASKLRELHFEAFSGRHCIVCKRPTKEQFNGICHFCLGGGWTFCPYADDHAYGMLLDEATRKQEAKRKRNWGQTNRQQQEKQKRPKHGSCQQQ